MTTQIVATETTPNGTRYWLDVLKGPAIVGSTTLFISWEDQEEALSNRDAQKRRQEEVLF